MDLRLSGSSLPDFLGKFSWLDDEGTWSLSIQNEGSDLVVVKEALDREDTNILSDGTKLDLGGLQARFNLLPDLPTLDGAPVRTIRLKNSDLTMGRGPGDRTETKLVLDPEDPAISRRQLSVVRRKDDWYLVDHGREGSELNGRFFQDEMLVIGDRFRTGHYQFEFTGRAIRRIGLSSGGHLIAHDLSRIAGGRAILQGVNAEVPAGSFIGVLGGSGQGKSTFLTALCGLNPSDTGSIEIDGEPAADRTGGRIGFVPQDDIVHVELTVRCAIEYSARLRLADSPSIRDISALVNRIAERLSLTEHLHKRISILSGGQRKRVSIATELLAKPSIIFLDEPSSGLDPATEYYLMKFLRDLAGTDCTVIATTHVLGRSYLFDRVAFIQAGRLVYYGSDHAALEFFKKPSLDDVYLVLNEGRPSAEEWETAFQNDTDASAIESSIPKLHDDGTAQHTKGPSPWRILLTLLARQWSILSADRANIAFLFAQAAAIAALIGWVAPNPGLRSFLAVVAVLWFGTSNASQQIVSEMPIFRRERVCGLGINVYIVSKISFIFAITGLQTVFLFFILTFSAQIFHPADYDPDQLLGDKRMMSSDPVGDIDQTPGSGVLALVRAFDFPREEAEVVARSFVIQPAIDLDGATSKRDDNRELLVYDEGSIVRGVEALGAQLIHDGVDLDSEDARKFVASKLAETNIPAPPSRRFLGKFQQKAVLTLIRWFGLQENVIDSAERKMLDSQGEALKAPYSPTGRILKHDALPLSLVIAIPIFGQLVALLTSALIGVTIGLMVSSLVTTPTQAAMIVPLILIPQILFAGFVITLPEMTKPVRLAASFIPSYSAQRVNEVASLYGQQVPLVANQTKIPVFFRGKPETLEWKENGKDRSVDYLELSRSNSAFQNTIIRHSLTGLREIQVTESGDDLLHVKHTRRDIHPYRKGMLFTRLKLAEQALLVLSTWFVACYVVTLLALRSKQPM